MNWKEAKVNKHLTFEDLASFWNYVMRESNADKQSSRSEADDWSGGLTWDESKELALAGWRDGMREIEKYSARIAPLIAEKVIQFVPEYRQAGHCVDVGRFLASDPEHFIDSNEEEKSSPGRVYKMVCSIAFSAAISPETIIQRGAMICALIDAIEYTGHRVEVVCNEASSYDGHDFYRYGKRRHEGWFEVSVTVKKSAQPLEMTDLAFCLAHPAMLRRMMFSAAEIEGWSDYAEAYGYPAEATDKGDIYIREVFSGTVPDQEVVEWVLSELMKLGIKIEPN